MPFSQKKYRLKVSTPTLPLTIACLPKDILNNILDSAVFISHRDPCFSPDRTRLVIQNAELIKIPGKDQPATIRDIISFNPDISIMSTESNAMSSKKISKVANCFESYDAAYNTTSINLSPGRDGF